MINNLNYIKGFCGDESDKQYLLRLAKDPDVIDILVLPTFKKKKVYNPLDGGKKSFLRGDGIVTTATKLEPKFSGFSVGCGQASFLVDFDDTLDDLQLITEASLRDFVETSNKTRKGFTDKIAEKYFGRSPVRYYSNRYSINPTQWLEIVCGGINTYLRKKGDPFGFLKYFESSGEELNHFNGDIGVLLNLLDNKWITGKSHMTHDALSASIKGAHYLDILIIDDLSSINSLKYSLFKRGKVIINIHANGVSFDKILKSDLIKRYCAGKKICDDKTLYDVIGLMKNQASINRIALAITFFESFKKYFRKISIIPLDEQAHYDIEREESGVYKYYCDVLRLKQDGLVVLPAGHPLGQSYLVMKSKKSTYTQDVIPHSLKATINGDLKKTVTNSKVGLYQICFPEQMFFRRSFYQRNPFVAKIYRQEMYSEAANELVECFNSDEIFRLCATLRPLARFSGRKRHNMPIQIPGIQT